MTSRTTSDGMSLWQSASTGVVCRGRWLGFFLGRLASALCAGRWSARAWARGSCCVERTTRCASCWQGARWRGGGRVAGAGSFFGRLVSALCAVTCSARALGPRILLCGAHDSLRLVLAGREVAWGRAFRGGWVFFWGRLASALCASRWSARALGPRVALCGVHDSLRLVLGEAWRVVAEAGDRAGSRDRERATPFSLSRPARAVRAGGLRPSSSLDRCAAA